MEQRKIESDKQWLPGDYKNDWYLNTEMIPQDGMRVAMTK